MLDVEALIQATATLRSLIAAGPRAWDGAPEEVVVAALGAAADLSRSCDAVKIAAAGAVARRSEPLTPIESLARRLGHSNTRRLVMDMFGVNGYVAGSWIEVAAAVQPRTGISTGDLPPARPAVAAALQAGELSAEIAKAIVEQLSKLTGETVQGGTDVAEAALVANATGGRINLFAPARVGGAAGSAGSTAPGGQGDAGPAPVAASQVPQAPQSLPDQDWATENGDPHDRAGQAWFGQQDHPAPAPGTSPGAGSDMGGGSLFGTAVGAGSGSLFGGDPGFGPGYGQGSGFDAGFGSSTGSPFGAGTGTGTGSGQGAGSPFSSGAGAGGVWPPYPSPQSSQGQYSSPASRPPAPYRPVLPPSMDDTARRRGIGSAIAGGRVGLDRVKEESRAWGTVLDPDGAEPRYEQQRRNRSFRLTKKASGGYDITGFAPDVEGNQIRTLLDAYLSPRTQDIGPDNLFNQGHTTANSNDGQPDGSGHGADTTRTHAQRSFDALAHILALHAASPEAPTTAGAAPTLLISTTLTAIDHHLHDCATHDAHNPSSDQAPGLDGVGAGWWPSGLDQIPLNTLGIPDPDAMIDLRFARVGGDGTPVPLTAVMHLLCDAALQIMLTDPVGVPLKLGRAQRLFSKDQRRVLIARDHHCRAPGCDIPAQWCEVHHVIPWQNGGKTNITNAILLCNFHHHEIDRGRLKVTHHPDTDARFEHKYTVETTWTPHQHHYKNTG